MEGETTARGTKVQLSTENFAKPHVDWLQEGSLWLARVYHRDWLLRGCPDWYTDWRLKMARIGFVFAEWPARVSGRRSTSVHLFLRQQHQFHLNFSTPEIKRLVVMMFGISFGARFGAKYSEKTSVTSDV